MTLYVTNPVETVVVAESVMSRIPTAELIGPANGATDIATRGPISLRFEQGVLTTPIVTVNGVIVFRGNQPRHGWLASAVAGDSTMNLTLTPPVGFAYRSVVTVEVDLEPEAGVEDDAPEILA